MKNHKTLLNVVSKLMIFVILSVLPLCAFFTPLSVKAEEGDTEGKRVLRVGCFKDMPYMMDTDPETGRLSGYGYEYLQTIAAYTGWDYEYVPGEWNELWQMLLNGEIDILEDVSYTEERASQILYSSRPIGSEVYRLYVNGMYSDIDSSNYRDTLKGTTVGVTAGTLQEDLFIKWVEDNDIGCEVVGYLSDEIRNKDLEEGKIDGVVELDASSNLLWEPVVEIGRSDYYIAMPLGDEELMEELNSALDKIYSITPNYGEQLQYKYLMKDFSSKRLTEIEQDWLDEHDQIVIGLFGNRRSPTADIIEKIMTEMLYKLELEDLSFSFQWYDDYYQMNADLQNGHLDAIYPFIGDEYLGEKDDISCVTNIEPVVISKIALEKNMSKYPEKIGLLEHEMLEYYIDILFPNAERVVYKYEDDLLKAISNGDVDVAYSEVIKSYHIYGNNSNYYAGIVFEDAYIYSKCLGVKRGNGGLYTLLRRGATIIGEDYITSVINEYNRIEIRFSWEDFFRTYSIQILIGLIIIAAIAIFIIVLLSMKRQRKLLVLSRTDSLTQLLNRSGELLIREKMGQNVEGMLCLLDVDKFKYFNDSYGHDAGDKVLIEVASALRRVFRTDDIVLRLGGDEYAIYASKVVDKAMAESIMDRLLQEIESIDIPEIHGSAINISVGVAFFHNGINADFESLYKKADTACYISKEKIGSCVSYA